jgi:NAD(P)H-hydrate epimerase
VVDGGSLQVIDPELIPQNAILTPHHKEFNLLKSRIQNPELRIKIQGLRVEEQVQLFAKEYNCVVLLKGEKDLVSDGTKTVQIAGGNAGMTKGGTGDVLAGLVAALYCKNEAYLSAAAGSFINKRAGESLAKRVGIYFNSSDLATEIPVVMKEI